MDVVTSLAFPVLAFTPHGVIPYSQYQNLLTATNREYGLGWFDDLELVDSKSVCAVVRSVHVLSRSPLSWLFGGRVTVEIANADLLGEYDVQAMRSRVLEFLSIYPDMHVSAGNYDKIVRDVDRATTTEGIVHIFCG